MSIRPQFGRLLFAGGCLLAGFQAFQWYMEGTWTSFPLSLFAVETVQYFGFAASYLPTMAQESINTLIHFRNSDIPFYLRRFLELIPFSLFLLVTGNFLWKMDKYLGRKPQM